MEWSDPTDEQIELLDVHGLDLLAAAEAMVRSAREYESAVQQLRRAVGVEGASALPLGLIHATLQRMHETCSHLGDAIDDITEIIEARSV